MRIDAKGLHYKILNDMIHEALKVGEREIILDNVNGQRYIGCGVNQEADIIINGVPGNDLAAFMNGPRIIVNGNGQDAIGNTMNAGKIVVHGDAGDVVGYSLRGGKIFIRGEVGYRVGIHMKSYKDQIPVIVIGGVAKDFFGEYMAGGVMIILGLDRADDVPILGNHIGTGMHGGNVYIRGEIEEYQVGKGVGIYELEEEEEIRGYLAEYCQDFGLDLEEVMKPGFRKLYPYSHRPYGKIYAY